MKMGRLIITLGIIVVVAALLIWLWPKQKIRPNKSSAQTQIKAVTPSTVQSSGRAKLQQPGGPYEASDPRWEERRERQKKDPNYEWKIPITFYGKVVDYDTGEPIPGVEFYLSWKDLSPEGTSTERVYSDDRGQFKLSRVKGKSLLVREIKKEGYLRSNVGGMFFFDYAAFWADNYHQPDPNKPVVFRMKKKGVTEPLIQHGPKLLHAKNDGTATNFNLTTGRTAANNFGELAVRITAGPRVARRFDWAVTVEGLDGVGLIESVEEFMVMAPENGYEPQWTFEQKANDEGFQSEAQTKFYVKTSDDKYARVEMRIIPKYRDDAAIELTVYLNPKAGSRDLEYEAKKKIKSP